MCSIFLYFYKLKYSYFKNCNFFLLEALGDKIEYFDVLVTYHCQGLKK